MMTRAAYQEVIDVVFRGQISLTTHAGRGIGRLHTSPAALLPCLLVRVQRGRGVVRLVPPDYTQHLASLGTLSGAGKV